MRHKGTGNLVGKIVPRERAFGPNGAVRFKVKPSKEVQIEGNTFLSTA